MPDNFAIDKPVVAIIGGGFTGATVALQLCQQASPLLEIIVFETRAKLGTGLAYSTDDPVHRLNAPTQGMSMMPGEPAHFTRWCEETALLARDPEAVLPDGRIFPRRADFGHYVSAQLDPVLRSGRVQHIQAQASHMVRHYGIWWIFSEGRPPARADIVVLATGHAPPEAPAYMQAAFAGHPRFIPDPTKPGALNMIGPEDKVLVVGTGLTMVDTVASLNNRGHRGSIHAVSRRGQIPRSHAVLPSRPSETLIQPANASARQWLVAARAAIAATNRNGQSWQAVLDALRFDGQRLWGTLPLSERRRALRHLRPFWETHRHRLPPQVEAILRRWLAGHKLTIAAASVSSARIVNDQFAVTLQPRGGGSAMEQQFDAVIVATGPGRYGGTPQSLVAGLLMQGYLKRDETGLGFACNGDSRARDQADQAQSHLLLAGQLARGYFGELTAVPEIAAQAESLARQISHLTSPSLGYIDGAGV